MLGKQSSKNLCLEFLICISGINGKTQLWCQLALKTINKKLMLSPSPYKLVECNLHFLLGSHWISKHLTLRDSHVMPIQRKSGKEQQQLKPVRQTWGTKQMTSSQLWNIKNPSPLKWFVGAYLQHQGLRIQAHEAPLPVPVFFHKLQQVCANTAQIVWSEFCSTFDSSIIPHKGNLCLAA